MDGFVLLGERACDGETYSRSRSRFLRLRAISCGLLASWPDRRPDDLNAGENDTSVKGERDRAERVRVCGANDLHSGKCLLKFVEMLKTQKVSIVK